MDENLLKITHKIEKEETKIEKEEMKIAPSNLRRQLYQHLAKQGVITDWREPDILRVAPVPLYNRYEDACELLRQVRAWAATGVEVG